MMDSAHVRHALQREIALFLEAHQKQGDNFLRRENVPVGFADAEGAYIQSLRDLVSPTHYLPQDILPGCTVILSCFLPFSREGEGPQTDENGMADVWVKGYRKTGRLLPALIGQIVKVIRRWGYEAAPPQSAGLIDGDHIYSNWSQRHIAYAAGLGTFGINNLLITDFGVCGRFFSLVTTLPVEADKPLIQERCLYKKAKACRLCVNRCPLQALPRGEAEAFNRRGCMERLDVYSEVLGADACGVCSAALPCSFRNPARSL